MPKDLTRRIQSLFLPAANSYKPCGWCPPVDVYEIPRGWLIKFDLAGVRFDDLNLRIEGRQLILRGIRRDTQIEQGQRSYSMEISYERFERSLTLPGDVENAEMATDYRDGMLIVRLTTPDTK